MPKSDRIRLSYYNSLNLKKTIMKKPKLIKEYLEVQSFQIKEYITINGRIITKRKKIDVIVHNTYKTEDYEKLLLNKFSLKNKIINFFEKLNTCTGKFNFINILSIIIIFFFVFKSNSSIKDNLDKFKEEGLFQIHTELQKTRDSLKLNFDNANFLNSQSKQLNELNTNKTYWQALALENYSFSLSGGACFGGSVFDIKISNGKIHSISNLNGDKLDENDFLKKYQFRPTIKNIYDVFNKIILLGNPEQFSISYDSSLKYPKSAFFNFKNCVYDEEGCWEILNFQYDEKELPKNLYFINAPIATFSNC